jgi:glutamine cyclotransferase
LTMVRDFRMFLAVIFIAVAVVAGVVACINLATQPPVPSNGTPVYGYRVVATFPHDITAFTQGLVYFNGYLYEGTGLNGKSSIRQQDLVSGEVLRSADLPQQYFGEGVTILAERIYQLTWQSYKGFVYDLNLSLVQEFSYASEGWGLTHNGSHLIMSDGTSNLYFIDPVSLTVAGQLQVTDGGKPVTRLNELEYINGEVWANVWQTDLVARISPQSGRVTGWVNFTSLLSASERVGADVLNGIAFDIAGDRILVTGKYWPKIFQIEIVP